MKLYSKYSRTFATLALVAAFALFLTFNTTQARASGGGDSAAVPAIVADSAPVVQLDVATGVNTLGYRTAPVARAVHPAALSLSNQRLHPDAEIRDYGNMQAWRRPVTQGGITYVATPASYARGSTGTRQLQSTRIAIGYQNRPRGVGLTIGRGGGEQGSLGRFGASELGGL